MRIRPSKIDLYALSEVALPFLGGLLFFSFIFLMFQILRLADLFILHGVSGWLLGKMTALLILSFLPMALPIAFLMGVLIGFGRLSADSELVAMKANGISMLRLSMPVVALSLVVVAISLGLNMDWVPQGDRIFKSTLMRVSNTKVVSSIREGTFTSGFFNLLIYADRVDTKSDRLYGVFIYDEQLDPENPSIIVAREGQLVSVKPDSELGSAAVLRLFNGNINQGKPNSDTFQKINFGEYRVRLQVEGGADTAVLKPRMIPYPALIALIHRLDPRDHKRWEMLAELSRRYAVALSPLIFVFLGMGFGSARTRSVRAGATLVSLVIVILYFGLQATMTVAARKGWIEPVFALQVPNIVTLLVAIRAFRTASW